MLATILRIDWDMPASVEPFRRRLRDNNLNACRWLSQIDLRKNEGTCYVQMSPKLFFLVEMNTSEYKPQFKVNAFKQGGNSIMVRGRFSSQGVGTIHCIKTNMDTSVYAQILDKILLPYAPYELSLLWVFQQVNDLKHSSKIAKKQFSGSSINAKEWPAQSPDVNLIENL